MRKSYQAWETVVVILMEYISRLTTMVSFIYTSADAELDFITAVLVRPVMFSLVTNNMSSYISVLTGSMLSISI
jgi:hypothetical protein